MIHYIVPLIVVTVTYFIGVFIGKASVRKEAHDNTAFDADLIQHVSYDEEQCGYEK